MAEEMSAADLRYAEWTARRLCEAAMSKVSEIEGLLKDFADGRDWKVDNVKTPEIALEKICKLVNLQNLTKRKMGRFQMHTMSADDLILRLEELQPKLKPPRGKTVRWEYSVGGEKQEDIEIMEAEKKEPKELCPHGTDINPEWPCMRCEDMKEIAQKIDADEEPEVDSLWVQNVGRHK